MAEFLSNSGYDSELEEQCHDVLPGYRPNEVVTIKELRDKLISLTDIFEPVVYNYHLYKIKNYVNRSAIIKLQQRQPLNYEASLNSVPVNSFSNDTTSDQIPSYQNREYRSRPYNTLQDERLTEAPLSRRTNTGQSINNVTGFEQNNINRRGISTLSHLQSRFNDSQQRQRIPLQENFCTSNVPQEPRQPPNPGNAFINQSRFPQNSSVAAKERSRLFFDPTTETRQPTDLSNSFISHSSCHQNASKSVAAKESSRLFYNPTRETRQPTDPLNSFISHSSCSQNASKSVAAKDSSRLFYNPTRDSRHDSQHSRLHNIREAGIYSNASVLSCNVSRATSQPPKNSKALVNTSISSKLKNFVTEAEKQKQSGDKILKNSSRTNSCNVRNPKKGRLSDRRDQPSTSLSQLTAQNQYESVHIVDWSERPVPEESNLSDGEDTSTCEKRLSENVISKTSQNGVSTKSHEYLLWDWTIKRDTKLNFVLSGKLVDKETNKTIQDDYTTTSKILSRPKKATIRTENSLYCLMGKFIPDKAMPEKCKEEILANGFPKNWKQIFESWKQEGNKTENKRRFSSSLGEEGVTSLRGESTKNKKPRKEVSATTNKKVNPKLKSHGKDGTLQKDGKVSKNKILVTNQTDDSLPEKSQNINEGTSKNISAKVLKERKGKSNGRKQEEKKAQEENEDASSASNTMFGDISESSHMELGCIISTKACLNSAKKEFENMSGRVTPPTPMLNSYSPKQGNSSTKSDLDNSEDDAVSKSINTKHVAKRMAKVNKRHLPLRKISEEEEKELRTSSSKEVNAVLAAITKKTMTTPNILKDVFRKKKNDSDSEELDDVFTDEEP